MKSGACDSLVPSGDDRGPASTNAIRARCLRRSTARASTARGTSATRISVRSICSAAVRRDRRARRLSRCRTSPPWTEIEQLNYEKEALGLYWTGHPIDRYADDLRDYGAKTTADLERRRSETRDDRGRRERGRAWRTVRWTAGPHAGISNGNRQRAQRAMAATAAVAEDISIGGIVSGLRPLKTRKGDRMCVSCSTMRRAASRSWSSRKPSSNSGHLAENGQTVLVNGKFERDDESARILASEIVPIELVRERLAKSVADPAVDAAARTARRSSGCWDCFAQHKGDRRVAS